MARPETALPGRSGETGFTLLELLVCLALLAAIAAFALPRFSVNTVGGLDRQAKTIAADLGRLRGAAIEQGRVRSATANALAAVLPDGLRVSQSVPPEIIFFPNGMSNGAVWRLESEGRAIDLEVDWLTGRVALHAR